MWLVKESMWAGIKGQSMAASAWLRSKSGYNWGYRSGVTVWLDGEGFRAENVVNIREVNHK